MTRGEKTASKLWSDESIGIDIRSQESKGEVEVVVEDGIGKKRGSRNSIDPLLLHHHSYGISSYISLPRQVFVSQP